MEDWDKLGLERNHLDRNLCEKLVALNDESMKAHQVYFIAPKFYPVHYKRKKWSKTGYPKTN